MLRIFHKYERSILIYIVIGIVLLSMMGFGVDFFQPKSSSYAIKVDKLEISHDEFSRERRNLEEMYRRQLGELYNQWASQPNWNISQQVVDRMIRGVLIERAADAYGLGVSDGQVKDLILNSMGGRFDPLMYEAYLRQTGLSAKMFEAQLRADALKAEFQDTVDDLSIASEREAKVLLERDETAYGAGYLEFDPAAYLSQVQAPDDAALQKYFEDHTSAYERPERAAYDYIVFDPKEHLGLVQLAPEDIELYYADHQELFMTQEEVKARWIVMKYPLSADDAAKKKLQEEAQEVQTRALGGEDFAVLAGKYSEDLPTKFAGGDLGWLKRGQKDKYFDEAAFGLKGEGVAELATAKDGFYIVKVDEYKARAPKPLADVKPEIEKTLRMEDAPGYTSVKAKDSFDEWQKSGGGLADYAKNKGLALKSTDGLLDKEHDVEPALAGLTAEVIKFPEEKARLVEQKDKTILVAIRDYKDADTPALAEIRERLLSDYKIGQSKDLAKAAASKCVEDVKNKAYADLKAAADALHLELKSGKDIKAAKPGEGIFAEEDARRVVLAAQKVPAEPSAPIDYQGKFCVIQVTDIQKPDMNALAAKVKQYQERQSSENAQALMTSLLNRYKAESTIDVAPGLVEVQ